MKNVQAARLVLILKLAMRVARRSVAMYACVKSRHDFTQPQLLACLVLKSVTKNDYRGVCELLELAPELRQSIGLEKVPHWTTLQKFMVNAHVPHIVDRLLGEVLREVGIANQPAMIAVDSTGLQCGVASLHYQVRQGHKQSTRRKTVKLSVAVVCGAMLPVALMVDMGSSSDMQQMPALMDRIEQRTQPSHLLADAAFDAEWVHVRARERWGAQSAIPVVIKTKDGTIRTKWRAKMCQMPAIYGKRWHAESFMSGLKRTMMSTLASRRVRTLLAEASMKVLAYALRR